MTLSNFKESLKKYAELAVDIGVAVKPGDTVYVQISVDQAQLARLIVAAAYQRGAAEVQVQWFDDVLKRLDMAHMADERLFNIPAFVKGQFDYWVDHQAKRITVVSSDPDNLAGIDSNRIAKYQEAFAKAYKRLMEAISSMSISWTIIGAASPRWAQKVFPDAAPLKKQLSYSGRQFSKLPESINPIRKLPGKPTIKSCGKKRLG